MSELFDEKSPPHEVNDKHYMTAQAQIEPSTFYGSNNINELIHIAN